MANWDLDCGVLPPLVTQLPAHILLKMDFETDQDLSRYKRTMTFAGSTAQISTDRAKDGVKSLKTGILGGMQPAVLDDFKAIGTGDFTIDFDVYIPATTNGYSLIFKAQNTAGTSGLILRIGDNGFNNRLQIAANSSTASTIYEVPSKVRSGIVNKWIHVKLQRKAGKISLELDQVKQALQLRGTATAITEYPDTSDWKLNTSFIWGNSVGAPNSLNNIYVDNIEVSNIAA